MKPRVRGDVSGSESMKIRRMPRVVAPVQINSFALEFLVETSCFRKSATSNFYKDPGGQARRPWFRKSFRIRMPYVIIAFSKIQKSVNLKALIRWVGVCFGGLILSLGALQE